MPTTSNFGWTTPADTDLVKDGAAAIRTLGNGIDASLVDLKGGTTGQILSKNSNTDLDYTWINNDQGDITAVTAGTGLSGGGTTGAVTLTNDMATTITASGDIVVGTGSGTYDNLPIGTTGQVLTADTTVSPYKVKWATPAGGGKVAQVVSTTKTNSFSTNSGTYTDVTGLSVSITPTSNTSTIMVFVNIQCIGDNGTGLAVWRLMRDSTAICVGDQEGTNRVRSTGQSFSEDNIALFSGSINFKDSPATTSATTYKIQIAGTGGGTAYVNRSELNSDTTSISISASTITVMEILA